MILFKSSLFYIFTISCLPFDLTLKSEDSQIFKENLVTTRDCEAIDRKVSRLARWKVLGNPQSSSTTAPLLKEPRFLPSLKKKVARVARRKIVLKSYFSWFNYHATPKTSVNAASIRAYTSCNT